MVSVIEDRKKASSASEIRFSAQFTYLKTSEFSHKSKIKIEEILMIDKTNLKFN